MFVGHYAPALALKAFRKSPSLAAGFVAVQLIDVGFFSLAYLGVEKWVANPALPGFTKVDLYFMPYTHSLLGAAWWALAAAVVAVAVSPPGRKLIAGVIIALLVVSHWFVDLLVHRNDLALVSDNEHKLGFGLWNEPLIAAPLELGLLLAGFAIYMRATQAKGALGGIMPWVVMAILLGAQAFNWMSPPPASNAEFSGMGLLAYGIAALLALSLDLTRTSREQA